MYNFNYSLLNLSLSPNFPFFSTLNQCLLNFSNIELAKQREFAAKRSQHYQMKGNLQSGPNSQGKEVKAEEDGEEDEEDDEEDEVDVVV